MHHSDPAVPVSNGLFTVLLNGNGEFGANAFNGSARWLQIQVCNDRDVPRSPPLARASHYTKLELQSG